MAKALKCDRCGQFYDVLSKERKYLMRDTEHFNNPIDLCPDCYEYFVNWLQIKEEENEELIGSGELYPGEFESRHYDFEEDSE